MWKCTYYKWKRIIGHLKMYMVTANTSYIRFVGILVQNGCYLYEIKKEMMNFQLVDNLHCIFKVTNI